MLFKSSNTAVIEQCRYFFHIELPSEQLRRRFENFLANAADKVYYYLMSVNVLHCLYRVAQKMAPFLYALTSSNINRFSELFYCQNQEKTISKDTITP